VKAKHFLSRIDSDRVVDAIAKVEQRTSAEIRVVIHHASRVGNVQEFATREFHRLKMNHARERNGVLILVAPAVREFAVVGDEGIHQRCGEPFWKEVVDEVGKHFRSEQFTEGLIHAIQKVGDVLKTHFPKRPDDPNKIPDPIVER